MAEKENLKFMLVETKVLPEVFLRVMDAKMLLAGYVLDWDCGPHELYVVCKEGGYRVSASELGIRRSEIEARIAKNSGFDLGSARRQPSPSDSRPGKRKGSAKESAGRTRNTRKANRR